MPFSGHARFANGFRFSSKRPLGKAIHDSFRAAHGNGELVAEGGPADARLFAWAMAIARCRSTIERAKNQAEPLKCWDLLKAHEKHYGIAVPPGASLNERRRALDARFDLILGPVRANIEYQLAAALGADFVAWITTPAAFDDAGTPTVMERTYYPMMPWHLGFNTMGPEPQGIFGNPPAWTRIRITSHVVFLGLRTVDWVNVGGEQVRLAVGDRLVVAPYTEGLRELVEVTDQTSSTLSAVFTKAHAANTEALLWPFPYWGSRSLHSLVVVPNGRAMDPAVRQKANDVMRRLMGGNSTWDVVEESTTPGSLIGFIPGVGAPGITPIEQVTF